MTRSRSPSATVGLGRGLYNVFISGRRETQEGTLAMGLFEVAQALNH